MWCWPRCGQAGCIVLRLAHIAKKMLTAFSCAYSQIDATVEGELAKQYGVQGYPTLKWFIDGELASDYNGPREA